METTATTGSVISSQYSAPEIINHPQLGFSGVVKCGDEYQFNSFSFFAGELQHWVANSNHAKLAAVLILLYAFAYRFSW